MMRIACVVALSFLAIGPAAAAVADSGANGFTVKISVIVHAGPEEVYQKLVHNVGDWWASDHTFSGDAHNLTIDDKAMGCWCEKLTTGGARHMEVVLAAKGKALVLSGGMGPLQAMAVTGALSFDLTPDKGGTKLDVTYAVGGYLAAGLNTLAAPVDGVLTAQMGRLKNFVELGKPEAPGQ
jgi:uncharacterized protein YndB with AHSA1/START domain